MCFSNKEQPLRFFVQPPENWKELEECISTIVSNVLHILLPWTENWRKDCGTYLNIWSVKPGIKGDYKMKFCDQFLRERNLCLWYDFWWLVRVTLVVAWWLFDPKFWEVVGTYESLFCSKMNAASVVVTCEVVGTLNHYKMVKKILNFVHLEVLGT